MTTFDYRCSKCNTIFEVFSFLGKYSVNSVYSTTLTDEDKKLLFNKDEQNDNPTCPICKKTMTDNEKFYGLDIPYIKFPQGRGWTKGQFGVEGHGRKRT